MAPRDRLEEEILKARLRISSDGYPMSIGELTNLYRDDELLIRPEYQRLFRWTSFQKSRLVESILLGIPLPSIFVAQTEHGTWELIDGLQRMATILELQGELKDESGKRLPMLVMEKTRYLPALEGRQWRNKADLAKSLSEAQRLDIKRSKIDLKIIKRESSPQARYDLFHRLNNYGTPLTSQEMRSALLVSINSAFFAWVESLAKVAEFRSTVLLSEKLMEERFDLELVIRFLVLHNRPAKELTQSALRDLPQLLDDESSKIAFSFPKNQKKLEETFKKTFAFISKNGGEDVFRKWDYNHQEFRGSFLTSAFEIFALGVGYNVANGNDCRDDLKNVAKQFWSRPKMRSGFSTGRSTESRLAEFIPEGRTLVV